jgi:exopolyphosphatase/guanosine-5'-triphosphate,3'-diphosphate pyrophosphatase
MKVAAIDIGANSVHLVISRLYGPGVREVLDREREMLRLGESTFTKGGITPEVMTRAMDVLKRYRAVAEAHGVEAVLAVATSAVRDARNRAEFVVRADKEARLAVRVLSGEEEGRLIYAGVRDGLPPSLKKIAVLDIGGGSAEIVIGDGARVSHVKSLKLGVLRLAMQFEGRREKTLQAMERHIRDEIGPIAREVGKAGVDAAVGTSGSILALAELLGVRDDGHPIRLPLLEYLSKRLLKESPKELAELDPVGEKRADTIGPGSLVVRVFMEESGLKELFPCERALREGVVADYAKRNAPRHEVRAEEISDPRRRSIEFLARRVGALDRHARQVARLSLLLFDALLPVHGLEPRDRELLEYAALLHDAGYWIGSDKHHKHAYYLIREGPLEGFSREEVQVIGLTARYHRGKLPRLSHEGYEKLSREARRRVSSLAALLRVGDGLDRSHAGLVKAMDVVLDDSAVTLQLLSEGDLALELYAAERRADLFRKVFDRELMFEARKDGAPEEPS